MRQPTAYYNNQVHDTKPNRICHSPHLSPLESSKTSEGKVSGSDDGSSIWVGLKYELQTLEKEYGITTLAECPFHGICERKERKTI